MNPLETYRFSTYLRDEWPTLLITVLFLFVEAVVLFATSFSFSLIIALLIMPVIFVIIALVVRYIRRRRFFCDLAQLNQSYENDWHFPQLLDTPSFYEGRLVYDCLNHMNWALSNEIDKEREGQSNYREFIELWVHEVKAPLAASLLALERQTTTEEGSAIRLQLERMEQQVNRALFYARSTALANDLVIRRLSLDSICAQACKNNARFLIEKGCVPQIDIPETVTVFSDEKWLSFIVSQIIINAAQYEATSIRFSMKDSSAFPLQSLNQSLNENDQVLEIADNGKGIPPADIPRVFERGFTGINGRQTQSSTGIGLYLVALMCKQLNIPVCIGSEVGVGTRLLLNFTHDSRRFDDFCE